MRLKKAEITNYRSIKNEVISFDENCRVLVGINESGKSNILRALSTLSPNHKTEPSDERQVLSGESDTPDTQRIRFIFEFDKQDYDSISESLHKTVKVGENAKVANDGTKDYTLKQLVRLHKEGLYDATIRDSKKSAKYWILNKELTLLGEWKKPSSVCPEDAKYTDSDGNSVIIKELSLIKLGPEHAEIDPTYFENATIKDVTSKIGDGICVHVRTNLPEVIFWEYSDKDLLPTQVNLSKFTDNPDNFIPLKNMFNLTGITDIAGEVQSAKTRGVTVLDNLLKRVARRGTEYLAEVWQEYKGVKFSLQLNGTNIMCVVSEENSFSFKDRSDGFKKFVAFLLGVSTTSHTDHLKDALILIDEPETGLHPSGARYLRDELLKISKKNLVVYSTHSIFMIDRHQIDRHLIVTKKKEVTNVSVADEGNIVHEEVIFNAINYSTFEHLSEYNLLFEGRWDRVLFNTFTKSYEKAFFKNIGTVHGKGVSSFRALVPTLELAERKAVILSDNDNAAKNAQKDYKALGYESEWKTYKDISTTCTAMTGEDFLSNDYIAEKFNALCASNGLSLSVNASALPQDNKLAYLKRQLSSVRNSEEVKEDASQLKEKLFKSLKKSDVETRYSDFVDDVKKYVEKQIEG